MEPRKLHSPEILRKEKLSLGFRKMTKIPFPRVSESTPGPFSRADAWQNVVVCLLRTAVCLRNGPMCEFSLIGTANKPAFEPAQQPLLRKTTYF